MKKIMNFIIGLLACISFVFAQQTMNLYAVYEQAGSANGYDRYLVLDPTIVYTGGIGSGEESIYIDGKGAVIDLQQGTGIWISGDVNNIIVHEKDNIINGLEIIYSDEFSYDLHLGKVFMVKDSLPYKVNKIERIVTGGRLQYDFSVARSNKSSMFILPMLGGNRHLFMYDTLFMNCFIATGKYKNCIALLYRFSGNKLFLKFEKALKQFKGFVEMYDPSPYFVMFIFKVPNMHKKNYKFFLKGQYSKFDAEYKIRLLDFHGYGMHGELAQILFKAEKRRLRMEKEFKEKISPGAELFSKIEIEEETFNPKIYI